MYLLMKIFDIKTYVCIKTYLYVLAEISAHHLQLKCTSGHRKHIMDK